MTEIKIGREICSGKYGMMAFALSFFLGILAASIILPGIAAILGSFLLSAAIVFFNRKSRTSLRAAFMLVIFLSGMLDYSLVFSVPSKLEALSGKPAFYEGIVIDNPAERGGYLQYTASCIAVASEGKQYNFREKVFLRIKAGKRLEFGDRVLVEGECSDIADIRNYGDFDYRLYYRSKGIKKTITAERAHLIGKESAGIITSLLYMSKEKVKNTISEALPSEEAAILTGVIVGDKSEIDEDTRDAYMKTGLSHLLSVSGLHVGFIMLLLTYALQPFKLDKKLQGCIILLVIAYYVLLIGAPIPSVRAFIMLAVLMAGKAFGRDYDLLASISFAGIAILIFKPLAVHDPGFMISFGAMYSIALLYPIFFRLFRTIPSAVRSSAALSLSVWLGLTPVTAFYFNYLSVISILINLAAVPLALVITIAGFTGVITGIISKTAALYAFSVDYYLIGLLNHVIERASGFPLAGFYIPRLPIYFYALYYVGLAAAILFLRAAHFRVHIKKTSIAYILAVVAALSIYNLPSGSLKIVFFDVGQGDGSCIITPGKKVILVDGGGSAGSGDYYYDVGGRITLPAILKQGIWRIDTVIVSHLHDDHMEGLLKVLDVYSVKKLILPLVSAGPGNISRSTEELLDLCRRKGTSVYRLGKGDQIKLGDGVKLEFLHPGNEAKSDENENSLVGIMSYGSFKALFTGDIGKMSEKELDASSIGCSVLKVPHHGSRSSSSVEFLEGAMPKVSVISVGRNNFGHPSADALKRLENSGSLIYRTDESGAVMITTDGKSLKVRTVKD